MKHMELNNLAPEITNTMGNCNFGMYSYRTAMNCLFVDGEFPEKLLFLGHVVADLRFDLVNLSPENPKCGSRALLGMTVRPVSPLPAERGYPLKSESGPYFFNTLNTVNHKWISQRQTMLEVRGNTVPKQMNTQRRWLPFKCNISRKI